jgi:hypothetical protein
MYPASSAHHHILELTFGAQPAKRASFLDDFGSGCYLKNVFVSLGGGCDAATNLKKLGLRLDPYPFDWLWNLDAGLDYVSKIVATDFKDLTSKDDYTFASHQINPGEKFLIFKNYPKIAHLHSNPHDNSDELSDYQVRIDRFRKLVKNTSERTTFIYYRNSAETEESSAGDFCAEISLLKREATLFEEMMTRVHPDKMFSLVSLLAIPARCFDNQTLKENLRRTCTSNQSAKTTFEIVPLRDDQSPEQYSSWTEEWSAALKRAKAVSQLDILRGKMAKRKIRTRKKLTRLLPKVSARLLG